MQRVRVPAMVTAASNKAATLDRCDKKKQKSGEASIDRMI
jgi:hypothetical protein